MGEGVVFCLDLRELWSQLSLSLSLSLDCLAHLVSLLGDGAISIHLEGLPRGRVNRW